jgi:hypothetical protein
MRNPVFFRHLDKSERRRAARQKAEDGKLPLRLVKGSEQPLRNAGSEAPNGMFFATGG